MPAIGVPWWTITGRPAGSPSSCTSRLRSSRVRTVLTTRAAYAALRRLPPARRRVVEVRRAPAGVGSVEIRPRRNDLVDRVEHLVAQLHVSRAELSFELLERSRTDDRRGHGRM